MTALVVLVAVFFLGMGVVALVRPERVTSLFGTPSLTVDGRSEVRAVYGGFGVAVAGLLVAALRWEALRLGALVSVGIALVGMALGRAISRVVDRSAGRFVWLFFFVELLLTTMLLIAARLPP
jgi:hypothetical protein